MMMIGRLKRAKLKKLTIYNLFLNILSYSNGIIGLYKIHINKFSDSETAKNDEGGKTDVLN